MGYVICRRRRSSEGNDGERISQQLLDLQQPNFTRTKNGSIFSQAMLDIASQITSGMLQDATQSCIKVHKTG